jgi:acyl-CoA synthetase (NDP forming)
VPCLRSIEEISPGADCALLIVPAEAAVDAIRQCADKGVKTAIIGATGFAEAGTSDGRKRQADILAIARKAGMRLVGPNTNGIYNKHGGLSLGYNSTHREILLPGPISIVSHSGALFGGVARTLASLGTGLSKFIPVGNEADLDMLDFLEFLIEDNDTTVIGLIVEALASGDRLLRLAAMAAECGKPIVALKVGRSAIGVDAALAHSSRLAGTARAYDALFSAGAIASVHSVEALAAGCALLAQRSPSPAVEDRRLICVASSGAGGALLADFAAERGMELAGSKHGEWEGRSHAKLASLFPRKNIRHPIDLGTLGDWADLSKVYETLEADGFVGPTVAYAHIAPTPEMDLKLVNALIERRQRNRSPIVVLAPGGLGREIEQRYRSNGIPVFHESTLCFESLACHFATLAIDVRLRAANPNSLAPGTRQAAARIRTEYAGRFLLSEAESGAILKSVGVPVVENRSVAKLMDARQAGDSLGYPLVLKAIAPDVAHKNKLGFVITSIQDSAGLDEAFHEMIERIKARYDRPEAVSLLLQPMLPAKCELIVGVSREPGLGHFLLIGLGGIQAELLDNVMLIPVQLDPIRVGERIAKSSLAQFLASATDGKGAKTLHGLTAITLALQDLISCAADLIDSIDLNPVIVTTAGDCVAVDALIMLARADSDQVPSCMLKI